MIQKCMACGTAVSAADVCCRACGFDQKRRRFLTMEEFEAWDAPVSEAFKHAVKPIQLFPGYQHMLILCGNGDLYAIGNNASGACGDQLPKRLATPTLIASHVRHAAAGYRHSLYADEQGKVFLIGCSDFADRFSCPFPVRKVYAHGSKDVFALEDLQGKYWVFGDAQAAGQKPCEPQILKTLEIVSYEYHENDTWVERGGPNYITGESHYRGPKPDEAADLPGVQQYMRSDEYRQFVREYGNVNVEIRFGKHKREVLDRTKYDGAYNQKVLVSTYRCTCQPEVVLHSRHLYKPVQAERFEIHGWFGGCWPVQLEELDESAGDVPG